jgi:hypothetical protein
MCNIHLIISNFSYKLGDLFGVDNKRNGIAGYLMEMEYSGELLVEQTIMCNSQGAKLTPKA